MKRPGTSRLRRGRPA